MSDDFVNEITYLIFSHVDGVFKDCEKSELSAEQIVVTLKLYIDNVLESCKSKET
jgi:hypothetical protein